MTNYSGFDKLCSSKEFNGINIYVIPGNHDAGFSAKKIKADNVKVIDGSPDIIKIGGRVFLFVPYDAEKTMGEAIEPFKQKLKEDEWVLIGHGDRLRGAGNLNPLEPGVYMPLSDTDIERYRPAKVILGHIHKITDTSKIHYPGSPAPLDINETGKRRFILLDTKSLKIESVRTDSPVIYQSEEIILLPVDDLKKYIKSVSRELIEKWQLSKNEIKKTRIRIKASGYIGDIKEAVSAIRDSFSGFNFYDNADGEQIDTTNLHITGNKELDGIASRVKEWIENNLDWDFSDPLSPSKNGVLLEALKAVYE
jgi:exonuclease SbcD